MSCPFCNAQPPDDIQLSSNHSLAIEDHYPLAPGHTLVIPRRHVTSIFHLEPAELADLWILVARVRAKLNEDLHPSGFNIGINDGEAAGQTVPHAHVHVIPRYAGDVPDPRGGVRWVIPEKAAYWKRDAFPPKAREETGAAAFAERVLGLLDQGSFTATYKYAVLLGLIDLCMERVNNTGVPPDTITTRQLAEKVVELYWPQSVPYQQPESTQILRQNTRGQAEILSFIQQFRSGIADDPFAPIHRARLAAPDRFERLIRNTEWKLIEMPLPRLQTVGSDEDRFVYEISFDQNVTLGDVRQYQQGLSDEFDNRILLKPSVAEYLIQLNGILRPIIHRQWAAMVARVNQLEDARIERFLFGAERIDLGPVRHALLDLQDGKCFYCNTRVRQHAEVDHFIPWSRYPDDALDNLVVADQRCNAAKRDFLASTRHVTKWRKRLNFPALNEIASATNWFRHSEATLGVVRAVYLRLPASMRLWDGGKEFVANDSAKMRAALG